MATVKIVQKIGSGDRHSIMLRVTHKRRSKYFSLGIKCEKDQWNSELSRLNSSFKGYKDKNRLIGILEERANKAIDEMILEGRPFTYDSFEKKFRHRPQSAIVFDFYDEVITDFKRKGKIGNASAYRNSKNALWDFSNNKNLMFADIDYRFLKKFEAFLFERGCSGGGISCYMRTLRAVINEAIRQGYLHRDLYPFATQFNKRGYSLSGLKSHISPRALSLDDMEKIKNFLYDEHPDLERPVRYFLFSYYCRGINFVDMAKLKWSDIYNGRIRYTRSKTGKAFSIKVSPQIEEILEHFRGLNETYIFPILNEIHQTPVQKAYRIKKCLKFYNRDLKEVAKVLEISVNLTSYVARHTYATTLKRKGVDIAVISEGLGHADILTTNTYLQQFSSEVIDQADQVL